MVVAHWIAANSCVPSLLERYVVHGSTLFGCLQLLWCAGFVCARCVSRSDVSNCCARQMSSQPGLTMVPGSNTITTSNIHLWFNVPCPFLQSLQLHIFSSQILGFCSIEYVGHENIKWTIKLDRCQINNKKPRTLPHCLFHLNLLIALRFIMIISLIICSLNDRNFILSVIALFDVGMAKWENGGRRTVVVVSYMPGWRRPNLTEDKAYRIQ